MRLEYTFHIADVPVPRFAVEAVEGIGKLFTLATLVVNVLAVRPRVEIVFHGLNSEDPTRKIAAFREILASCEAGSTVRFQAGQGGHVPGSSSYFQWLSVERGEPA